MREFEEKRETLIAQNVPTLAPACDLLSKSHAGEVSLKNLVGLVKPFDRWRYAVRPIGQSHSQDIAFGDGM